MGLEGHSTPGPVLGPIVLGSRYVNPTVQHALSAPPETPACVLRPENPGVGGSIPSLPTITPSALRARRASESAPVPAVESILYSLRADSGALWLRTEGTQILKYLHHRP